MEHLVEDLKSAKGTCVVLNYIACMIYSICTLSWLIAYVILNIFRYFNNGEKWGWKQNTRNIWRKGNLKMILFSVWNKIKIIAIWLVIVSVIKRLSVQLKNQNYK